MIFKTLIFDRKLILGVFFPLSPKNSEHLKKNIHICFAGGGITMKSPLPHGYYRSKNVAITVLTQWPRVVPYHNERDGFSEGPL